MIKLADTLAPMSNDFYAVESENVGIDIDGTSKSIQQAYEDGDLSGGGSSIQVDTMPIASAENENMIVEYVGASGTYQNGYFYQNIGSGDPKVYSWVQKNVQPSNATATDVSYDNTTSELVATNVQDAIDEIKGGLGTASGKNFTDLVRPNSHELVESGSVYSAINNALSSIYTPRGELTCAELTSSLLIEDNVGNIYTMSDSGTTSALFINGAGLTINVGDNVGIIKAGADTYLFNYMGNAFDLTDYQKKELTTAILGEDTVEGALGVIAEKDKRIWIGHKADWDLLTTAEKIVYDEAHFDDDEPTGANQVTNAVTNGDMRAVTSNAVYDGLKTKQNKLTNSNTGVSLYGNKDVVLNNDSINIRNGLHPIDAFPQTLSGQSAQGTTSAYAKALYERLHERYSGESCVCIGYNSQGEEYTVIVSMAGSGNYGSVVRFGYKNTSAQIIRKESGSWKDNDWVNM